MVHEIRGAVVVHQRGIMGLRGFDVRKVRCRRLIELISRMPISLCQLLPMAQDMAVLKPAPSTQSGDFLRTEQVGSGSPHCRRPPHEANRYQ